MNTEFKIMVICLIVGFVLRWMVRNFCATANTVDIIRFKSYLENMNTLGALSYLASFGFFCYWLVQV